MPQYEVGHLARVAEIRGASSQQYRHVAIAGAAGIAGVGIPDCIPKRRRCGGRDLRETVVAK